MPHCTALQCVRSGEIQGNNLLNTEVQSSRAYLPDLILLKNGNGFGYMLLDLIVESHKTLLHLCAKSMCSCVQF